MKDIRIIAHRGAMAYAPENSLESFGKALEMGSHIIETDVRTTSDGEAVLMHDSTVNRTTTGYGKVSDLALQDIKVFRLRNREAVPTLREALELLKGRCVLNLELKDAAAVAPTCKLLAELDMWNSVIISSFTGPWLMEVKLKRSKARIAFISDDRELDTVRIAKNLKAEAVHLSRRVATRKLVNAARSEGLDVNVWVVNRSWQVKKYIEWGVDGIITDRPDLVRRMLDKYDDFRFRDCRL
ncbi:MAG: glycerophosphodiester phosphodiesterase [Candidatus Thermoplasmatota archaeon]|nr:glycerophosphodiester phosphodiesterase [Euryarchaeota archaeon]MBU4032753.1 glycerophosphodiester phosphodiesterase [Candidatus Thermoplasmatota archaeon]MBU4070857.1 glycerophosphodiester phosphodiesterase [Candidatus Thermoplasmatota archaeon]MBU4145090.1 glycerophosphodiester phosphodiesterase [Candidatus Thermoplasmatota archaeon]MBU4592071.1 glycerophosphodiester phosphodiesterase [Candidatus Thermoplasmatota archaeon]